MPAAFDANVDVIVELGFGSGPLTAPALITWTDISTLVKAASWLRGRSSTQQDFPAGSGTLALDNSDGRFYPWNTASPYSPNVTVGVPIRIRATHNAVTYPLFRGYVERWPSPFPTGIEELATISIVETVVRLTGKRVTASYSEEPSDDRVANILDDAGWPATARDLGVGVATVAGLSVEQAAVLDLLRQINEAEQGQVFQAADGDLTFLPRTAASTASSQATFGPDGAELIYVDVAVTHDDDLLFNEALVVGADELEQSAADATSVDAHGPVTYESTNPAILNAGHALNVAEWVVAIYKDVTDRIVRLVVDPPGDPANLWPEVLDRELRDVITVEASFPGSSTQLVQEVAVESVAHSFVAGGTWTVTYGCHPLSAMEQTAFWILGTSDDLGTDTILA